MQSLNLGNLSKHYGKFAALSDVSLKLDRGQMHALMGENGAGKSTLIKLVAGVVSADSMEIDIDGQALAVKTPRDAHTAGFRFIHQELNIVPTVSVAENIALGRDFPRRFGAIIDWPALNNLAETALHSLGVKHVNVSIKAGRLSSGDRMLVKIASALVARPGEEAVLYVLDEPTAALTDDESERLFAVLDRLRKQGAAILYVSHRINEVMRICDHVTVLRDGKQVFSNPIADTDKHQIITAMTGRQMQAIYPPRISPRQDSAVACAECAETNTLSGVDFSLRAGEVLGVAGLADAGQSEVLKLFMGLERVRAGKVSLLGQPCPATPPEAWRRGVAYIPGERRSEALMLNRSICANTVLSHLGDYGLFADKRAETAVTVKLAQSVRLKFTHPEQPVSELSGGNQQKVVFARALAGNPALLLLDEPTRGVDVGAKYDVYKLIREVTNQGCGVILASSDLPEILGMCDRVMVLQEGRQTGLLDVAALDSATLLENFYKNETVD